MTDTKAFRVQFKADGGDDLQPGQFRAYASVFGNKDSYGDIVQPGAFTDTLTEWKASGMPIPLLFGHNMSDPDFNLGSVEAVEDEKGLLVVGTLDSDQLEIPNSKTAQVYRLLKSGRVNQMSFAFDVLEGGQATQDGESYYSLDKLKLYEVSVVPIGANQETEVLAVKTAAQMLGRDVKEGRVLASKHVNALKEAHQAIGAVIEAAESSDEEKAAGHTEVKPAAADVKSPAADDNQRVIPSADSVLALINITELEGATA